MPYLSTPVALQYSIYSVTRQPCWGYGIFKKIKESSESRVIKNIDTIVMLVFFEWEGIKK